MKRRNFRSMSLALASAAGVHALGIAGCGQGADAESLDGGSAASDASREAAPEAADGAADALGVTDAESAQSSVTCSVEPCMLEITSPNSYFNVLCARRSDETVWCWGDGAFGVLGVDLEGPDAGPRFRSRPTPIAGLSEVLHVRAGGLGACALSRDGRVRCWGDNYSGRLGQVPVSMDDKPHPTPEVVAFNGMFSDFSREDVGCGLATTGELVCWGDNTNGTLLVGAAGKRLLGGLFLVAPPTVATLPPEVRGVSSVVTSSPVRFLIDREGTLFSWGTGADTPFTTHLLGRYSSLTVDPRPTKVFAIQGAAIDVSASSTHACAIAHDDSSQASTNLYCWGTNASGQLGIGSVEEQKIPLRITLGADKIAPRRVSVNDNATCVLFADGTVSCAGDNTGGRIGLESELPYSYILTPLRGLSDRAVDVRVNAGGGCALLQTGAVECWGGNDVGQLGTGANDSDAHPMPARVVFP